MHPIRVFPVLLYWAVVTLGPSAAAQHPPATSPTVQKEEEQKAADSCCSHEPAKLEKPAGDDPKSLALYELAMKFRTSTAQFFGGASVTELRRAVALLKPSSGRAQIFRTNKALGDALLAEGDIQGALQQFESIFRTVAAWDDEPAIHLLTKSVALCWMRLGERENCVGRHNQDSCLLPLQGAAFHVDQEGSTRATKILTGLLRSHPDDDGAMWLLNVAQMTLGTWPEGVPQQWRISPQAFASEYQLPRMFDIAPKLGLNEFSRAGGSILDDFDGDGLIDVAISSMDPEQCLRLFRQKPDGSFEDVAAERGLAGQLGGLQLIHFDANNDGRFDLLVQRGAWLKAAGEIPNSLLIQQPDGRFVDTTERAGIEICAPSQVAAVADMDNDGDLDLFLGYESESMPSDLRYGNRLFRNRGDGTFDDVTAASNIGNGQVLACKGAAFADYDGDRLPDLYLSNLRGPNQLFHNDGGGRFTNVAAKLGVENPVDGFACWFFDYNNDGWLDIFATCYDGTERGAAVGAWYRNHALRAPTMRLYENDCHGGFNDVTRARGLERIAYPMGCNFGDVDNDGWPDIYLATGDPEYTSLWPNVMFRNDGGQRFQDVTTATDTGHLQKGHGVSFADIDDDGDQDLYVKMGGAFKDDGAAAVLFENPGHGNHWLTVRLIGRKSNRFGVGARIRARIDEPESGERDVYAFVGMNSSFGGNSLQEEMGLGRATRIVELEVDWPTSTTPQTFTNVPLDRTIVVDEGAAEIKLVPRRERPASRQTPTQPEAR